MKEEWKDIAGYEGYYEISNCGMVRSLFDNHEKRREKPKILKPCKCRGGYLHIGLHKDGKGKYFMIHRLVTEAFLPNPSNLPFINHKDEDKTNNCVGNLEWCSVVYNNNYGSRNARIAKSKLGHKCSHSRPIECYDKEMNLISTFESSYDAMRKTGINADSIRRCCRGEKSRHTAGGFIWKEVV